MLLYAAIVAVVMVTIALGCPEQILRGNRE